MLDLWLLNRILQPAHSMARHRTHAPSTGERNAEYRAAQDARKVRNRLSQQAFRERQAMYVMGLEKQLHDAQKTESARIKELERENRVLRDMLLALRKKIRSIQASLEGVAVTISDTVLPKASSDDIDEDQARDTAMDSPRSDDTSPCSRNDPSTAHPATINDPVAPTTALDFDSGQYAAQQELQLATVAPTQISTSPRALAYVCSGLLDNPMYSTMTNGGCNQQPIGYFDGASDFGLADLPVLPQLDVQNAKGILFGTESLFSAHILAFESCLKRRWEEVRPLLSHNSQRLRTAAEITLSIFVCMAWPHMITWHTYTRAHIHVARVMMWRLDPNPTTYASLATCYRPTRTQLSTLYPAIIDWIPFPSLRDRVIAAYAHKPELDDVICDIGGAYVVEGDLSRLIGGLGSTPGYVGVWDLISTIAPTQEKSGSGHQSSSRLRTLLASIMDGDCRTYPGTVGVVHTLPAPSPEALFSSPDYAALAFQLLGMANGTSTFRMDPAFFEKYPRLYDAQAEITARGTALRPASKKSMPMPLAMTLSTLQRYDDFVTWFFDIAFENAHQA